MTGGVVVWCGRGRGHGLAFGSAGRRAGAECGLEHEAEAHARRAADQVVPEVAYVQGGEEREHQELRAIAAQKTAVPCTHRTKNATRNRPRTTP